MLRDMNRDKTAPVIDPDGIISLSTILRWALTLILCILAWEYHTLAKWLCIITAIFMEFYWVMWMREMHLKDLSIRKLNAYCSGESRR